MLISFSGTALKLVEYNIDQILPLILWLKFCLNMKNIHKINNELSNKWGEIIVDK